MSLVDKVAALRNFFGVDEALELIPAVATEEFGWVLLEAVAPA